MPENYLYLLKKLRDGLDAWQPADEQVKFSDPETGKTTTLSRSILETLLQSFYINQKITTAAPVPKDIKLSLDNDDFRRHLTILLSEAITKEEYLPTPDEEVPPNMPNMDVLLQAYKEHQKRSLQTENCRTRFQKQIKQYNKSLVKRLKEEFLRQKPSLTEGAADALAQDTSLNAGRKITQAVENNQILFEQIPADIPSEEMGKIKNKFPFLSLEDCLQKSLRDAVEEAAKSETGLNSQSASLLAEQLKKEASAVKNQALSFRQSVADQSAVWGNLYHQTAVKLFQDKAADFHSQCADLAKAISENSNLSEEQAYLPAKQILIHSAAYDDLPQEKLQESLANSIRLIQTAFNIELSSPQELKEISEKIAASQLQPLKNLYSSLHQILPDSIPLAAAYQGVLTSTGSFKSPQPPEYINTAFRIYASRGGLLSSFAYPILGEAAFFFGERGEDEFTRWLKAGGFIRSPLATVASVVAPGALGLSRLSSMIDPVGLSMLRSYYQQIQAKLQAGAFSGYQREIYENELKMFGLFGGEISKMHQKLRFLTPAFTVSMFLQDPVNYFVQYAIYPRYGLGGMLGSQALLGSIFAHFRYGAIGGNYITGIYLKSLLHFGFKYALTKTGLFAVVGPPFASRFVFVPFHKARQKIFGGIRNRLWKPVWHKVKNTAVAKAAAAFVAKFGSRILFVATGVGAAALAVWSLRDWIKKGVGGLVFWAIHLIGTYGPWIGIPAAIGGLASGIFGAMKGAAIGASIGTAILPIGGTLIGGAIGAIVGFIIGFLAGSIIGGVIGWIAMHLVQGVGGFLSGIGSLLGSLASSASGFLHGITAAAGNIAALFTVKGFILAGSTFGGIFLFVNQVTQSAFFVPQERGGGISGPINVVVVDPDCSHPACQIERALNKCGANPVNQSSWISVENCLSSLISPEALEELRHSVFEIENNSDLQCVGFKIAAEKQLGINLPRQNAAEFLNNHPGCDEIIPSEIQVGDNAVWGPRVDCSGTCETDIKCCGHIAVVTRTKDKTTNGEIFLIEVTQAWGNNGAVNTIKVPRENKEGETQAPVKYLRCHK